MIKQSFMRIFWGLLFIVLDINISNFDVMPDFIGYILIYSALNSLEQFHPRFRNAKPCAAVMVIVSAAQMLHINPFFVSTILGIGLDCLMIWHTCNAISEMALARGNLSLSETSTNRRTLYSIVAFSNLLLTPFLWPSNTSAGVILIPLLIVSVTAVILVMMLMRRASIELS